MAGTPSTPTPEEASLARRAAAMASPDTAITFLLAECDRHLDEFWADMFAEFLKNFEDVWYEPEVATEAFLEAYLADADSAIAAFRDDPETFGRLAHPRTAEQNRLLLAYIQSGSDYPTLQECAEHYRTVTADHAAVDALAEAHPDLYDRLHADHMKAVEAETQRIQAWFHGLIEQGIASRTAEEHDQSTPRTRDRDR